ncbi:ATP-binding protein [Infirmifilum lucidum]|uniref:ATP-binding protein n=1 Tax=Infirmifilum lucidum TaxID=2776706 RepID=A0A7L9FH27_9CREN|nr:ATP-binding protein [Infirmifilum lucidum]QOJ78313.1 ATP-binding protein [Infirmifilum lucidum]
MEEIGKIVNVFGRNILRIAVPDTAFEKISRPGTYVIFRSSSGIQHLALVTGYLLVDELYKRGRVLEELEGYEDITVIRNEVTAVVVGYIREGKIFKGVESLPAPGERVFLADPERLKLLLSAYDVDVGTLASTSDVNFTIDLNMLASRHFAVLAMTGSGKSNTVAVVVSRILEKYPNPRIVLIDTHSEYIPLAKVFKERVRVFSPGGRLSELVKLRYGIEPIPLEVPMWTLGFEEIAELLKLDSRATKQLLYLREALLSVRRERWPHAAPDDPIYFKARQLVERIGSKGGRDDSAIDLKLKLSSLLDDPDLSFITSPVMSEKIYEKTSGAEPERSGRAYTQLYKSLFGEGLNIIALGGLPSEVQVTTVATILRALWRVVSAHVQAGSVLPTLVIVEEAHVYAPKDRDVPSRQILEKIAKEGRKFGVGLGIVSQRPRELSQTLLAQCGTLIALRTTNPEDQRHIMLSVEDIIGELIQGLASLTVGQALISGAAAPVPAIINVHSFTRIYSAELGGKDVDWSKAWAESPEFIDISRLLFAHRERSIENTGPGEARDRAAKLENFLQ